MPEEEKRKRKEQQPKIVIVTNNVLALYRICAPCFKLSSFKRAKLSATIISALSRQAACNATASNAMAYNVG